MIDISDQSVERLQGHVLDDILVVARRLVLDQPLQNVLFPRQLA